MEENKGYPEVKQVLNDMKKRVAAPKGGALYLRGILTLVARIYRTPLKANGWKKPPSLETEKYGDASGRKILATLSNLNSRRINYINKSTNPKVDQDFLQMVHFRTKEWDKILHPEEGIREYSMKDMFNDFTLVRKMLQVVSETIQNQPKRSPVEQISIQNKS